MCASLDLSTDDPLTDPPAHSRYQFKPLRGSSHSWALESLTHRIKGCSLLDVGAGSGWLGTSLRPLQPRRLVAVEIDRRSHGMLREVYDEVQDDISMLGSQRFDCIALLDVLEHLPKPIKYLHQLRSLLSPTGIILLSVPNVAHWSVRFPLFFLGRFEYQSLGIMDHNHLQFFSRQGFLKLCEAVPDTRLEHLSASIEPFERALPRWVWSNPVYRSLLPFRLRVARTLPGLMAYQHLAILRGSS